MKKWIFSIMLVLLTVILASCGSAPDTTTKAIVADYSGANLSITQAQADLGEDAIKDAFHQNNFSDTPKIIFHEVRSNTEPTTFDKTVNAPNAISTTDQTVTYVIAGLDVVIPYFVLDTQSTESMLVLSFKKESLKYHKGESSFNLEGLKAYEVFYNGNEKQDVTQDLTWHVDGGWPTVIKNDNGYQFYQDNLKVNFVANEISTSLTVRVDGGEDPITWNTSNWWGKITAFPVAWLAGFAASLFNNSFALGIIIATIIIRTLAWPIYAKSNDLSSRMGSLQPEVQKIEQKYALKKDPQSQQRKQMEMAQLYKKHGVGLSGCLMPFLQMPIFLAMYQVVRRVSLEGGTFAHQVSNTMFLGIDLANDTLIWRYIFAALVGATMFLLQKISAKKPSHAKKTGTQVKTDQQAQQEKTMRIVMLVMVGMMTVTAATSTALGFYWIIGNLYSLAQTLINRKLGEIKAKKASNDPLFGGK